MTHSERILIVEDNRVHSMVIEHRLQDAGYEIETAFSDEEAIEKIKNSAFDLIILDIRLPEGTQGFNVARFVRERKEAESVPILALTVLWGQSDVKQCKEFKMEYIRKPFDVDDVIAKVKSMLQDRAKIDNV